MSSKSTKTNPKQAGKGKESKGTKKPTGPSMKDVDKLQKENEDLRKQLRVASGKVAYLRENLDPSAFRKAAEITTQDETQLFDDAMKSAEEIINKLKCELKELKGNKQSQAKEMDGKTGNEKDVSKDGGNAALKAETETLKEEIKRLTTQLSDAERNNRKEMVQRESKIENLKKERDYFKEKPVKSTAPTATDSSTQKGKDVDGQKEISTLRSNLEQTKQKLNISLEEEKRLKEEIKRVKDDNEKVAKQRRTEKEKEIDKLQQQLSSLRLDLKQANDKLEESSKEEERLKLLNEEYQAKLERNNANNGQSAPSESNVVNKFEKDVTKLKDDVTKLEREKENLSKQLAKEQQENKDTLQNNQREKENLSKQLAKEQQENKVTLQKNQSKYEDGLKEQRAEIEKLRKENDAILNKKDNEINKLQKEKKDLEDKMKVSPSRRDQRAHDEGNDELRKKLKDANEEITELRNRLSKVVGAKLSDDNPNITDLSDENRPTKLAEKYSELYDNEWTDAYEYAETEGLNEQKSIKKLLGILMGVDGECRSTANEFKNNIKRAALSLSENGSNVKEKKVDVTRNKLLKEMQKSFAPLLVEDVYKNLVKKNKLELPKNTERFYRSCVELCWLMSVQDPPVVFDTPKTGGKFDSDRYRTYTKTGKQLDYVVWPPMLLHTGGPLLAKGVAQGK